MIDILATELPAEFRKNAEVSNTCLVRVRVEGSKAQLTGEFQDEVVAWSKEITWTDIPEGEWNFYIADDADGKYTCILLTEY